MAQNRSKNAASSSTWAGSTSSPGGTTAQVDGEDVLVTSAELAEWLSCSTRTVRQYEQEGLIAQQGRGKFRLKTSVKAVVESMRAKAAGWTGTSAEGETLSPAAENAALARQKRLMAIEGTRLAAVRAEVAETELAIVRGRVLDVEQIVAAWSAIVTAAKGRLMGLAPRLATQIHGLDRREVEIISREVRIILDQLVEDGEAIHENAAADAIKRRRAAAAAQTEDNTTTHDGDS